MNFIIYSLFSLLKIEVIRSVVVIISHGLRSSRLFYIVKMYYVRSYKHLIIMNKEYINYIPIISH